jgi:SAM-dependent methyltransferase
VETGLTMTRLSGEPAVALETADCPLCGAGERALLFVARDRLLNRPGSFPVVRCARCGFVYLGERPAPDALLSYYPETYYPLGSEPSPAALAVASGLLARVEAWLARHPRPDPTILDIGCGTGLFLSLAQQAGYDTRGIELSAAAVAYGRQRFGLEIDCGALDDVALPPASFDVVTLWHVLEHLPNPVGALRRVKQALRPDGLLLLGVPNFGSLEARLFGRRWYSLDAPRHFSQFTPETLARALVKAGLEVEHLVVSPGTAGLVYSVMGDLTGVSLKLRGRPLSEHTYHEIAARVEVAARPLCTLAARLARSGAIEAYATKPDEPARD